ncbi:MAG: hypothetical protein P1U80_07680 [Pseudomonadales bacterium]|nr:hypothetical protein [Pseudomonadales bacterium]
MSRRKIRKVKRAALIVVGEGPQDKAFLNHMKHLYDSRTSGQTVTINSADGGSPGDIIETVRRKHRHADFDKSYILLDSDITITQQNRDAARKRNIELIESTPYCLEGMLLDILGQNIPSTSRECKTILHPQLNDNPATPSAYTTLFPGTVLNTTTKHQIVTLRNVIANKQTP